LPALHSQAFLLINENENFKGAPAPAQVIRLVRLPGAASKNTITEFHGRNDPGMAMADAAAATQAGAEALTSQNGNTTPDHI